MNKKNQSAISKNKPNEPKSEALRRKISSEAKKQLASKLRIQSASSEATAETILNFQERIDEQRATAEAKKASNISH